MRRALRQFITSMVLASAVGFTVNATAEPVQPLLLQQEIETTTKNDWIEVIVAPRYPTGVPIVFEVRNLRDEALSLSFKCDPVILRDKAGQLYETDHNARKGKAAKRHVELAASATASTCTWDGKTTFETSDGYQRVPMPGGRYEVILILTVTRASGENVDLGGFPAKAFDLEEPALLEVDAETRISEDGSVRTMDGTVILTNRGVGYAHLANGGNLSDARLTIWANGEFTEAHLMREGPNDPHSAVDVGAYRIELLDVDAYHSGAATVRVTTRGD